MATVAVIEGNRNISNDLVEQLDKSPAVETCHRVSAKDGSFSKALADDAMDTAVYCPSIPGKNSMLPDLVEAENVFQACARANLQKVVVVSSAAIYGATPHHPPLISEAHSPSRPGTSRVKTAWFEFEELATTQLTNREKTASATQLTILRPASILAPNSTDYFSQLFSGGVAGTVPLYDPSLQLLSPKDLATAVCCAVEKSAGGVYNVAPNGVIPLRVALRMAGSKRFPVPAPLQKLSVPADQPEYIRYAWNMSGEKIHRELGFAPEYSSAEALIEFLDSQSKKVKVTPSSDFDELGLDPAYINAKGKQILKFLHNNYFRIELKGFEHVPREGRGILTGVHRGFMPFDGVMLVHLIARELGRYIRTLIHPCLVKMPFPFNFQKLGGVNASREMADYVLQQDELLSWFPEGITGAFRYYRNAYQLGKFGRDEYVKAALRNQAPIIPFVTVGSVEIFPILAKINWKWWKRQTLWPCFPIAPPFPLVSFPLPSKWHTQFLEPIHLEKQYPPEAAEDEATVKAISQEIKARMQEAIDDMLRSRKHIYFGSIFKEED
jgi:nucleoside-diphosphate-sugar epimerase/1-acyl-sn-glycerol-3-phosphate acyltransferase